MRLADGRFFGGSSLHSCAANLSRKYRSAFTRSIRTLDGVRNLYWHRVQEAIDGTPFADVLTIRKLRSAILHITSTFLCRSFQELEFAVQFINAILPLLVFAMFLVCCATQGFLP